jgi:fructoselysine-6-P-deglycase FrlB-like protein
LHHAPFLEEFAPRFAGKQVIYTTASGASYGAVYFFAICVLMKMLWINSQAITLANSSMDPSRSPIGTPLSLLWSV